MAQRRKHKDPYALAQAKQRKAVNLARQEVLRKERTEALGDPVRGISTPFLESFDDVGGSAILMDATSSTSPEEGVKVNTADNALLNHFLTPSELEESLKNSYSLTKPVDPEKRDLVDPVREAEDMKKHAEGHARAVTALTRIVSLANASQKDKTRANTGEYRDLWAS